MWEELRLGFREGGAGKWGFGEGKKRGSGERRGGAGEPEEKGRSGGGGGRG